MPDRAPASTAVAAGPASARVAPACRVASTSDRHGSNATADARSTTEAGPIPCAAFLAFR